MLYNKKIITLHFCSKSLSEMCKAILTISLHQKRLHLVFFQMQSFLLLLFYSPLLLVRVWSWLCDTTIPFVMWICDYISLMSPTYGTVLDYSITSCSFSESVPEMWNELSTGSSLFIRESII